MSQELLDRHSKAIQGLRMLEAEWGSMANSFYRLHQEKLGEEIDGFTFELNNLIREFLEIQKQGLNDRLRVAQEHTGTIIKTALVMCGSPLDKGDKDGECDS